MRKNDEALFRIGEVTKTLGITRKTLLVFENMGLLTPAVKDAESGYRYYSPDNMTQIKAFITGLQKVPAQPLPRQSYLRRKAPHHSYSGWTEDLPSAATCS